MDDKPLKGGIHQKLLQLRCRDGSVAVEFAILIPILLVLLTATVTLFLLFQASKISERATFTVGDIISRRTTVDTAFLDSTYQLFLRMTERSAADVNFRVSSLKKQSGSFTVAWSYAVASQTALANVDIPTSKLPLVTDGDSIILVETVVKPPTLRSFTNFSVADYANMESLRPRFTAAISKSN
jgi:Flp pilus assembly protein TadG